MLPQQDRCVICREATSDKAYFWATCEQTFTKRDPSQSFWHLLVAWVFFGWLMLILLLLRAREDPVHGTNVRFRLPLRVCSDCRPDLRDVQALRDAVVAVPIYADLLEKYPDTELVFDPELR
jgi:hypothetical protein